MDDLTIYFAALTGVAMVALALMEERGHRLVTLAWYLGVYVTGTGVAFSAMYWGWV